MSDWCLLLLGISKDLFQSFQDVWMYTSQSPFVEKVHLCWNGTNLHETCTNFMEVESPLLSFLMFFRCLSLNLATKWLTICQILPPKWVSSGLNLTSLIIFNREAGAIKKFLPATKSLLDSFEQYSCPSNNKQQEELDVS